MTARQLRPSEKVSRNYLAGLVLARGLGGT